VLYYSYGETRWSDGTLPTDYQFTGQRAEDFGLYDYHARYYDGAIGRFISADTVVPQPGNPQDFNRYSYVRNSPLNYRDPSGHAADSYGNRWSFVDCPLCEPPSPEKVREVVGFMAMGGTAVLLPEIIGAVGFKEFIVGAFLSELGYVGGTLATGGERIDPVDAYWAFLFGGLPNPIPASRLGKVGASTLWGAGSNATQYTLSSLAKGEELTTGSFCWAFGSGTFAGLAGQKLEQGIEGSGRTLGQFGDDQAQDFLVGAARSIAPTGGVAGDVLSQVFTYALQNVGSAVEQLEISVGEFLYRDYDDGRRGPIAPSGISPVTRWPEQ